MPDGIIARMREARMNGHYGHVLQLHHRQHPRRDADRHLTGADLVGIASVWTTS